MFKDLLSDALTCIRNGVRAKKNNVEIRTNNVIIGVLRVLQEGGFIKSYDILVTIFKIDFRVIKLINYGFGLKMVYFNNIIISCFF